MANHPKMTLDRWIELWQAAQAASYQSPSVKDERNMHREKLGLAATSGNDAARARETLADLTIQKDVRSAIDRFRRSSEKSKLKSTVAEQSPEE
jgi:hypothetical protein